MAIEARRGSAPFLALSMSPVYDVAVISIDGTVSVNVSGLCLQEFGRVVVRSVQEPRVSNCDRFDFATVNSGLIEIEIKTQMPTFLFWNLGGRSIGELVSAAAFSVDADCVVLCECSIAPGQMLESLNQHAPDYRFAFGECEHVKFFTKFDADFLVPTFENARISIRRLDLPGRQGILVAAAHLPSRLYQSAESLVQECVILGGYIEREEELVGHSRTILLGDLNVNPFESGVVGTAGLHAVLSRSVAARGSRIVQGRQHHFFYNPMWSHFGDRDDRAPGTYYYERAEAVNYFWNIYDQVLLRPELLGGFSGDSLRVLTSAGQTSLLDNSGRPDRVSASDHLPIVFSLNF